MSTFTDLFSLSIKACDENLAKQKRGQKREPAASLDTNPLSLSDAEQLAACPDTFENKQESFELFLFQIHHWRKAQCLFTPKT